MSRVGLVLWVGCSVGGDDLGSGEFIDFFWGWFEFEPPRMVWIQNVSFAYTTWYFG